MRAVAILLVVAALGLPAPATAYTNRADFIIWCTEGSVAATGRCIGYLRAIEDTLSRDAIEGVRACLPRGIKLGEQYRIVLEWLQRNPYEGAATVAGLVARAYAEAYPCK